jgi:hypothetical protein
MTLKLKSIITQYEFDILSNLKISQQTVFLYLIPAFNYNVR